MSRYPMEVTKIHFDHRGGTKDYNFTLIETADDKAIIIKRWGKIKTPGQFQVLEYETSKKAATALSSFINERVRKGYIQTPSLISNEPLNWDELKFSIGRAAALHLSADNVTFLDPSVDTTGMRTPEPPKYDEDGEFIGGQRKPRRAPIDEEAMKREEVAKAAAERAVLEHHPLYGRF